MSAEIGELQRRLANILRVGTISEIDLAKARVKVSFQGVTTAWLPWATGRAGAVKDWSPPSVGEQVCILSPSGELGAGFIISGGINSDANAAPDARANVHVIEIPASGAYEIRVGSATFSISGGKVTFNGDLEVTGDVKAGSISLKNHVHAGVQSGGSSTAVPS